MTHAYSGGAARNVARERIVTQQLSKIADVSPAKPPFNRFGTLPAIDGFEVVDADGRSVGRRDTLRQATGAAYRLNQAAANGQRALARALGCR